MLTSFSLAFYSNRRFSALLLFILFLYALHAKGQDNATPAEGIIVNQSADNYRKAAEAFARLDQSNNFAESLSYADMNTLPMGLKHTISNTEITIAVSDIRWETTHT